MCAPTARYIGVLRGDRKKKRRSRRKKIRRFRAYGARFLAVLALVAAAAAVIFVSVRLFIFIRDKVALPQKHQLGSSLVILEDGAVIETVTDSFDDSLYDKDSLREMINSDIEQYSSRQLAANPVTLKSLSFGRDTVTFTIEYASGRDYASFNQKDFAIGDMSELLSSGRHLTTNITNAQTGEVMIPELSGDIDGTALFLNEDTYVTTPSAIRYYSRDVTIEDEDRARISGSDQDAVIVW